MNFEHKTILITGASTGIGKALAQKLLTIECNLALVARRKDLIESWVEEFGEITAKIKIVKCDVSKKDDVSEAFGIIQTEFGRIDIAILNSGIGFHVTPETYDSKYAEETINTNFLGVVYWVEKLLPDMMERKSGTIAGVSSVADNRGYSHSGFYSASKAALSIYLNGLAVELHNYGIKVITIKPGFVKTPLTDKNNFKMPFMISAEKAADIIFKGMKKNKSMIQFPLPTVISTKIIGLIPNRLYGFLENQFKKL